MILTNEQMIELVPFIAFCCQNRVRSADLISLQSSKWWLEILTDVSTPGTALHTQWTMMIHESKAHEGLKGGGGMDDPD